MNFHDSTLSIKITESQSTLLLCHENVMTSNSKQVAENTERQKTSFPKEQIENVFKNSFSVQGPKLIFRELHRCASAVIISGWQIKLIYSSSSKANSHLNLGLATMLR